MNDVLKAIGKEVVETDAKITIWNVWRELNETGTLKTCSVELLNLWLGAKQATHVINSTNALVKQCKDEAYTDEHMSAVMSKVWTMLDWLCSCDEPLLENAGRHAKRKLGRWVD